MPLDTVIALALFAALMVGTPGPANLLAMTAGAHFGFRACLPFIVGLTGGKLLLNIAMAVGLLTLLTAAPTMEQVLKIVSGLYLLWLAWRTAGLRLQKTQIEKRSPPGFWAGLIVHPLNPKAWAMATSAYAQFTDAEAGNWALQSSIVALAFLVMQAIAHPLWCISGVGLAKRLSGTAMERWLMRCLSLLLVAVVIWAMLRG